MAAPRRGAVGAAGARGATIRWDTHDLNGGVIMRYDEPTVMRCKARLKDVAKQMENYARTRKKWTDHPDKHPSRAWPNPRWASKLIFAYVRGKRVLAVTLTHSPGTIWVRKRDGATFNYGIRLETWHGGEYAIIRPTAEWAVPLVARAMVMSLNNIQGPVADLVPGDAL